MISSYTLSSITTPSPLFTTVVFLITPSFWLTLSFWYETTTITSLSSISPVYSSSTSIVCREVSFTARTSFKTVFTTTTIVDDYSIEFSM